MLQVFAMLGLQMYGYVENVAYDLNGAGWKQILFHVSSSFILLCYQSS